MKIFDPENRADVEGIVTGGLRAKRDAADREAREKRTEASDEAATQEAANRVSQQAAAATKRTAVASQKMLELLQVQPKEFEKIVTAINEKNFAPEVLVSLDGKSFTQYVIDHPRGTKDRIVIVPLG
jgi:pyrroline-5-carboxylate reductase